MGHAYYDGVGVEQSYKKAVEYWEEGDRTGFGSSQYELARMYQHGIYFEKNEQEALRLYEEALIWYERAKILGLHFEPGRPDETIVGIRKALHELLSNEARP